MSHPRSCLDPTPAQATGPGLAAVISATRALAWEPCPLPVAAPGTLAVRTARSLISPGTELSLWNGTHASLDDPAKPWVKYPFRPGYAAAGEVIAVGEGLDGYAPGDRVVFDGRHAAHALVDPATALLARLPAGADPALAPFARLLQIASCASDRLPAGCARVTVLGAGLVGLCAALWLAADGRQVVIEDPEPARRAQAEACGLAAAEPGGGGEPEAIVDATGHAAVIPAALARVRRNGTVVVLGSPRVLVGIDLYHHIHAKGVALVGAHEGCMAADGPTSRQGRFSEAVRRIAVGAIAVAPLLTRVVAPASLAVAYDALTARQAGWLGVELEWDHA